jgi:predicted ATP-binding protein involved in virulence
LLRKRVYYHKDNSGADTRFQTVNQTKNFSPSFENKIATLCHTAERAHLSVTIDESDILGCPGKLNSAIRQTSEP